VFHARKIEVDDPDRGKWFYTWDGPGRVRTQLDAKGITLAYQYDAMGRMERRFMLQAPPAAQNQCPMGANFNRICACLLRMC
jgi:YD repeat-containing protein